MQVFECDYCHREFHSRRARGGHLKVHRPRRASQQAGSGFVQPLRVRQVSTSAPIPPPPQKQPNTSQELALVVSQPHPRAQQEILALPEPNTNNALVTIPVHLAPLSPSLKNDQEPTPVVLFRCCCGITEKIPQTKHELMEHGTYKGGCFTLYVHELLSRVFKCIYKQSSFFLA
jgi:hypothetical protein